MSTDRAGWFREAKYGMFIHWGLYAEPGGIWNGAQYPYGTEWIMRNAQIPLAEYRKLSETFNPTDFNADVWLTKAVEYGVKYLCITAKHHDGFSMYDSKVSNYTIMHTPFGRDIIKELSDACKKYNVTFCVYYSQMQDWEDPDGDGNTWDFDPEKKNFETYFYNKVKPQVRELLTNYGEIGMIFFDTPYNMPRRLCRELEQWVHSIQPMCLINGRIGYGIGDTREMGDNEIPVLTYRGDWETPMTLNNTWGYSRMDENWKSPQTVMKMLIDVAGKNGNLILNVGPDPLGNFPEGGHKVMKIIGDWLKKNGESIYGTKAGVDFPYQMRWGGLTSRDGKIYMHVLNNRESPNEVRICNLETKVNRVFLLETGDSLPFFQSYEIARDEYRFRVILPKNPVNELNSVVVVELEGEPVVHSLYMNFDGIQD